MTLPLTIKKTVSRLVAVQALYADDIRSHDRSDSRLIIDMISCYGDRAKILDEKISDQSPIITPDEKYLAKLIITTIENKEQIDQIIEKYLMKDWNLEKLSGVIRSILRAGVCELKYFVNIPSKVSINEYTNLTREFYSESEVGFINGILDKISFDMRNDN